MGAGKTSRKKAFLVALKNAAGNVTAACEKVSVSRQTFYNWLERYPKFAAQVAEVEESLIDLAETQLLLKIKQGDVTALIFFLKCKAKDRGYVEKQLHEHQGKGGGPIEHDHVHHLSDEELDDRLAGLMAKAAGGQS